jgi:hypothetical protein
MAVPRPAEAPPDPPVLRSGLAIVPVDDGLLVDGSRRRRLFTGQAATSVLLRLLPLLDGEHDIEALSGELDLPRAQAALAVSLLRKNGLLESSAAATPGSLPVHVATYFSRAFGTARELSSILASATVLISAPDEIARPLAGDLSETGLRTVLGPGRWDVTLPALRDPGAAARTILIVLDDPDDPDVLAAHVAALRGGDALLLRCAAGRDFVELGPAFREHDSACLACFRRAYREAGWEPGAAKASEPAASLLAGLLGAEVLALVADTSRPASLRALSRLTLADAAMSRYTVSPNADCPECGWLDDGGTLPPDALECEQDALNYDWLMESLHANPAITTRPDEQQDPQEHDFQKYLGYLPHRDLQEGPAAPGQPKAITGDLVATILGRLAGRGRVGVPVGGGPDTGDLNGVELYVLGKPELFGLPGSIYRYDSLGHRLFSVRSDNIGVDEFLDGCGFPATEADVALACVGPEMRLARRDGALAARMAHIKGGQIAARLSAIAADQGIRVSYASRWNPEAAELLELGPDREFIVMIAALTVSDRGA